MTPAEVLAAVHAGALVVDTRPPAPFAAGHVPGALPVEFQLADLTERAELLLPRGLGIVVHAEPEAAVLPSVGLLEDAGLEVRGHLDGGLAAWRAAGLPVATLPMLEPAQLAARLGEFLVLDVREPYEHRFCRIPGSMLLPSGDAWAKAAAVDPAGRPVAVVCSGQGRSCFVAALLARCGVAAAVVRDGMWAWERDGHVVVRGA